jgi:hypothetical protein
LKKRIHGNRMKKVDDIHILSSASYAVISENDRGEL